MERRKEPIVEKPKPSSFPSLSEQLASLTSLQEQTKTKEIWRDEVEIRVKTRGLPFMFIPLSDFHIGAKGVDYASLKEYLSFLKDYPVYTVLIGDLADNFSPTSHPSAMKEDLIQPTDQWSLVRAFFKEYQNKILTNVSGNHDEWTWAKSGVDIFRWISEDCNIPLLRSGGVLRLKVDDIDYKIRLWHKIARLNSQFNFTHAGKQALRLAGDESDVIITGDKHLGSIEQTFIGDKKRTIIQLGTLKTEDSYGRSQGFVQKPKPFYPVLFFFQGKHNIEAVEDLHQAKEVIDMMRRFYRQLSVSILGLKSH